MCNYDAGRKGTGKIMNTPVCDFVKKYAESDIERLHMPGHKGHNFLGCEKFDITEVCGADALYSVDGIIAESEKNATTLFGSKATFYSTEGSSQCIKAMLCLAKMKSGKKNFTVLAARNVHKSFIYACCLLDINVRWLFDENDKFSLCRCNVTAEQLDCALNNEKADAVYVTSPDYLGGELDIKALSDVTHAHGAVMLVDNAHGAYLRFLDASRHPMDMGADMCCDSAHKTLPVLTGGAYLHIGNEIFIEEAKKAMEMFGSTSPSYLILQSLDLCNVYLANGYKMNLHKCIENVEKLKRCLSDIGWTFLKSDPLKLTVLSTGIDLSAKLRKSSIESEYEDPDYTVMMFTPETPDDAYDKILSGFGDCDRDIKPPDMTLPIPEKCMKIRDAIFSDSEKLSVDDAVGHIVADTSVGCPPAVSVLVSGERISEDAVKIMKYYGIEYVSVVK